MPNALLEYCKPQGLKVEKKRKNVFARKTGWEAEGNLETLVEKVDADKGVGT